MRVHADKQSLKNRVFQLLFSTTVLLALAACGSAEGDLSSLSEDGGSPFSDSGSIADLELSNITAIPFDDNGEAIIQLEPGSPDDQFLLILNSPVASNQASSVAITQGASTTSSLQLAQVSVEEEAGDSEADQFHISLRELESELARQVAKGDHDVSSFQALNAASAPSLGDNKDFNVLNSLSSASSTTKVTAELRYISDDLYVYVDLNAPDALTDEAIERLASDFEDIALPREREVFGRESDLNADGHITILMTPVINKMASSGGIVTGFFFPGDLVCSYSSGSSSNCQEIFYTLVPDPYGVQASPLSVSFVMDQILPGVLAHEYEHMVAFNQRVLLNHGSVESPWLEEAKAHFAEDLTGFSLENFSRVKICLSSLSKISLVSSGSPGLAVRGCGYLLLRYLYEQSADGDAFLGRLETSKLTGVKNIEESFQGSASDFDQFSEFFSRWTLALALSNTGLTTDARVIYQPLVDNAVTGNPSGMCLICSAPDSRGTVLAGPSTTFGSNLPVSLTVNPTSSQFITLARPASDAFMIRGSRGTALSGWLIQTSVN